MTAPQPFQSLLLPTLSPSLELVPLSNAIELKTRDMPLFITLTYGPEIFIFM